MPRDQPWRGDGPERGDPARADDLRLRLDRLPPDHPSSPQYLREEVARRPQVRERLASERVSEPADARDERLRNLGERMLREVPLRPETREKPAARDVIPHVERSQADPRKLAEYSMNQAHPQNNGKYKAWAAVGYDIASPERRQEDARDLRDLICQHLLPHGRVLAVQDAANADRYRVVNGFIGPNGRHANLLTVWLVAPGEGSAPRLLTTWLALHKDDRP